MTIHNVSSLWKCLKHHQCYLHRTSSSHPAVNEEKGKGKDTQSPQPLVQKAVAAQPLDWVCGFPLMMLLPIMVFCFLQQETCTGLSHCLARSESAFMRKAAAS